MLPAGPIVVREPVGLPAGLVVDSPHSGMDWPDDFHPGAPRDAILTTWDAWVDELWAGAVDAGATLVAARFPRAYVDANRAADDLDPALLADPWPTPLAPTDYSRRGMGLVRRLALPGIPMYDAPLPAAAVRARLDAYYLPYRAAVARAVDRQQAARGVVWHLNVHSMKSRGNAMNVDAGAARPDFVVSDRDGTTADPSHTAWVAGWLAGHGYRVQVNDPYRGGDLVRTFGAPSEGRHSIQIEINRALYMDEAACTRHGGFAALAATLTTLARDLAEHIAAKATCR
ncbi:MAG: N-formylglutamate amidohydrolase [Vicinamibacteria bacterium]